MRNEEDLNMKYSELKKKKNPNHTIHYLCFYWIGLIKDHFLVGLILKERKKSGLIKDDSQMGLILNKNYVCKKIVLFSLLLIIIISSFIPRFLLIEMLF